MKIKPGDQRLMIEKIDIEFTDNAVRHFINFLANITDYKPTLCLYKSRNAVVPEDYWGYGVYAPEKI